MGNDNIQKDPNIEIYLQLKSIIFLAGSKVRGTVYLQVQQYSTYSELILRLQCFESTSYIQQLNKNDVCRIDKRKTYIQQKTVYQFKNGLYKGQHQFPFSLLLPSQFPGSLILSSNDFIRYKLTAYLQSSQANLSNQLHERQIWIFEPFRFPIQPIFQRFNTEIKCCGWGFRFGFIQLLIQSPENILKEGQNAKIKIEINSQKLSNEIKIAKLKLIQKNVKVTQGFHQEIILSQIFSFDFNQNIDQTKSVKILEKIIQIPKQIYPTCVGQIISRYYTFQLRISFSWSNEIVQNIPIFLTSNKNLIDQENKYFEKPENWKPIKYKKPKFSDLKRYNYESQLNISFSNQRNRNLENMDEKMPRSSRKLLH